MRAMILFSFAVLAIAAPVHAQIDWHAPRAAGRVWEDKIDENNRQDANRTAAQRAQAEAADAAWDAPLSEADLQGTLARNRAEYDRRLRLGQGFADNWLDRTARMERFQRGKDGSAAPPISAAAPPAASACSAAALPASERQRMEAEYARRFTEDGKASADGWAQEQGRRFRQELTAQGICPARAE